MVEGVAKEIPNIISTKAVKMCRIYLKVLTLSDITHIYGYKIDTQVFNSKIRSNKNEMYKCTRQEKIVKGDWSECKREV